MRTGWCGFILWEEIMLILVLSMTWWIHVNPMKSVPFFPSGIPVLSVSKYLLALQGCPCSQLPATLALRHWPKVPQWNPLSISWRQVQISCKPVSEKYWSHPNLTSKDLSGWLSRFWMSILGTHSCPWSSQPLGRDATGRILHQDLRRGRSDSPRGPQILVPWGADTASATGSTKHRSNSNWWKESFTQTNFIPFLNLLSDSKSGNDADPQQNRHVEFPSRSWGVSKEVPPTHLVDKMVHLDCWMTPLPINNANTASLKIIPSISFWRQFFCPWICCIFSKASKGQPIHLSIFWIDRLRKVLESSILVSIWGCWGLRASPFQAAWQIHYCSSFEQCRNLYLNCLLSCWS